MTKLKGPKAEMNLENHEINEFFDSDPSELRTSGLPGDRLPKSIIPAIVRQVVTLLYLDGKKGEKYPVRVMIDNGSEISMIASRFYDVHKDLLYLDNAKESKIAWQPPNGSVQISVQGEVTLFGRFSNKQDTSLPMPVVISDLRANYDMIIGLPLIQAYHIQNSFSKDGNSWLITFPQQRIQHEIDMKTRKPKIIDVLSRIRGRTIHCLVCEKQEENVLGDQLFKCCGQCNKAWYCSSLCQQKHWSIHKNECEGSSGWKTLKNAL